MQRERRRIRVLFTLAAAALSAACSGGGGAGGGDFQAVGTEPVDGATIYLNDAIAFDFTAPVDIHSADLSTVAFQALDALGAATSEPVTGTFQLARRPGDVAVGRRLLFVPSYPTDDDYQNGGFAPGRVYVAQLVGGRASNGSVLRDGAGKGLAAPLTIRFRTREGTQPEQLFRNPKPGGPRRSGLAVSTATSLDDVPLGLFGAPPLEVRLSFDQALDPRRDNVPVAFDSDPLVRDIAARGRIWLEYKDPEYDVASDPDDHTWIPADIELEANDLDGAVVVLRPVGVLPNAATVRVMVAAELRDIAGESNVGASDYRPLFGTFRTDAGYGQQWDGIVEDFRDQRRIDFGAVFPESLAEVGPGYVRAGFAFEGNGTSFEYEPVANEVVLNTAFTQIVPKAGLPITVTGGVFNFRNVTIPQGVTVVGRGPNPMVWLCSGDFTVAGTLSVRGGDGARVDTLASANVAKAGGIGVCGGGNGGDGTPSATLRDVRGGTGRGPLQTAGRGGRGGEICCSNACYTDPDNYNGSGGGSGGGGGSMATQGDPAWRGTPAFAPLSPNVAPTANTVFQQLLGFGGSGCSGLAGTRSAFLAGGPPGDLAVSDARGDNDFWGTGIDLNRRLRIVGELAVPVGGGGGGGGGDTAPTGCTGNSPPIADFSGGGGGGGGGVLVVKALGTIKVTATGHIVADGGHGGGGEQVGACGEAGGGGGGAGGMVVLMSATAIVIEAHGRPLTNRYLYGTPSGAVFAGNDYDFAISADGGVCLTGTFGTIPELGLVPPYQLNVAGKYPASGQPMLAGNLYDANPLGGLGGMGIVQLMAPPGDNTADGTNTILDDHVHFRLAGSDENLTGAAKRQLLAWRGFPDASGVFVDDAGTPTGIGSDEGDIRPAPILLPSPFQARSRVRSKWIDTGASQRRPLADADGAARGLVVGVGAEPGPRFAFAGTDADGYVAFAQDGPSVRLAFPVAVPATPVAAVDAHASHLGAPAYRLELAAPALGAANRFVQHEAELQNASGERLAGFRIVAHDDRALMLDPGGAVLPTQIAQVAVIAKFVTVVTNGNEGLGPTYQAGDDRVPIANVRIGFAFHRDPDPQNLLAGRYPDDDESRFVHDLAEPGFVRWLAGGAPRYVMWDVEFDLTYEPTPERAPALSPSTPRPELRALRLPFRF